MFGYSNEELLNAAQKYFKNYEMNDVIHYGVKGFLGQGCFRTAYQLKEYPDIVFKFPCGDDEEENVGIDMFYEEMDIWERAIENGVYCFAQIEYLGRVTFADDMTLPVFIQEKVEVIADRLLSHMDEQSLKKEKKVVRNLHRKINNPLLYRTDLAASLIRKHGLDYCSRVFHFMNENGINDLHAGNWGIKDNSIIIFDYCYYET